MKKKEYIQPETEVLVIEGAMLCTSGTDSISVASLDDEIDSSDDFE